MATYTGMKEILKEFRDRIYPIGITYVQYPQQKSPEELFPGTTWEVIDYDGAFFRASGGNADGFIEESGDLSMQAQSVESHSHDFSVSGTTGGMSGDSYVNHPGHTVNGTNSDRSKYNGSNGEHYNYSSSGRHTAQAIYIDLSHTHSFSASGTTDSSGASETRPQNFTMRIWKRTA